MPRVRAVLFDLDNTLHDRDLAFLAWARRFVRDRLGRTGEAAEAALAAIVALDAEHRSDKASLFRRIAERYPVPDRQTADHAAAFRAEMPALLSLAPGAPGLLAALDAGKVPWGIVTNGSASQYERIRTLGLADRVFCAIGSEVVGLRKPDPAIFLLAAARLGVSPDRVVFVGDNPEDDIAGAARAGMRTAWLRRGRAWPDPLIPAVPDHTVDALDEIRSLVVPAHDDGRRHSR